MANIFAQMKEYVEKHKRNTFDLSFSNNLTFKFGQLVPVFCKEVIPGDSFKINPAFGLRLMPMVFPVQTKLNANLHFFYVRNRNLWKDWMDFIGRTKSDLIPPYIARDSFISTGSLADYLGLPTTLVGDYGTTSVISSGDVLFDFSNLSHNVDCLVPYSSPMQPLVGDNVPFLRSTTGGAYQTLQYYQSPSVTNANAVSSNLFASAIAGTFRLFVSRRFDFSLLPRTGDNFQFICNTDSVTAPDLSLNKLCVAIWVPQGSSWIPRYILFIRNSWELSVMNGFNYHDDSQGNTVYTFSSNLEDFKFGKLGSANGSYFDNGHLSFDDVLSELQATGSTYCRISISSYYFKNTDPTEDESSSRHQALIEECAFSASSELAGTITEIRVPQVSAPDGIRDVSVLGSRSPYNNAGRSGLYISALPFRAYESIYNAFYRNQFNDPFILDGKKEYNKFIRTNEGGGDISSYELYNRNYELDFLTSAKQSPVDGDLTPLVGVNASGKFTFQNQDGTTYTVTPQIGEDGHTLTGIESMEGVPENNTGLRRLVDAISLGISINDFRNVNALQRWLETNLRRGYRYRDQVMSHFGVDISYEELDMPEFIGGMSNPVLINKIDQHTDQTGNPEGLGDFAKVLGSFAGQGSVFAQAKHSITKYCDEHGFIIGILSVTPTPCYSQILPKFFTKNNVLDYYFPEFGHIGNQPITYKEVCPIQAYAAGDALTDVFGYQRAWYDYVASVDEIHGDFRKSLDGFLITRIFNSKPELGKDFIECREDTMSNPFSVIDQTDKILGQVYFDVTAQRPIPKFGIPRLE